MDDLEQLQLLGRGGYASVYLVQRRDSPKRYALKRIPRSKIVSDRQKSRLKAEKLILQQVTSPFLCRGFEFFETDEEVGLLQEYVEGRALYECVWKFRESGRFPEKIAKFFAAQLVLAMRDLHSRGFVHRDLTSGNVLVGLDGFAKVIDFGLSKKVSGDGSDITTDRTQSMCGTHYVMAPEVFFRELYGVTIDWWSLGVVVYEMVVGRPPWEYQCPPGCCIDDYFHRIKATARSPFENAQGDGTPHPTAELQSIIRGLLNPNPAERLGRNGAPEVMQHLWFHDIDWELLESKDTSLNVPYNAQTDFNAARIRTPPPQNESLSSAESIDPEENAKYFVDF